MQKRHSALLAVTCMLVGACSTALSPDPSPLIPDGATTTTIEQTTDPLSPGEDSTTTTTEVEGIRNPELQAAIDELIEVTEEIRELTFKEPPKVVFVTQGRQQPPERHTGAQQQQYQ